MTGQEAELKDSWPMERISNQTITDTTIRLDDYEFIDCEFVNCNLEYSGGFFILNGVRKVNCRYVFLGPAHNTVAFLQAIGLLNSNVVR
jgi:hypothetical protein